MSTNIQAHEKSSSDTSRSSHTTSPTTQTCSFFSLPRECRDTIYELLLTSNTYVEWPVESFNHNLTPSLLGTCRQIHHEAAVILYTSNLFCFTHPADCTIFRSIMDRQNAGRIHDAMFKIKDRLYKKIWKRYFELNQPPHVFHADLPQLKQLLIFLNSSYWQPRRHAEDNLQEWFRNEIFNDLCRVVDATVEAETAIFCRQQIPQYHFDHLRTSYAVTSTAENPLEVVRDAGPGPVLVQVSKTRLQLPPIQGHRRNVVLELISPHDEMIRD